MTGNTDDIIMANGFPMPTRKTRKQFVIATIIFCWATIALLLWQGDPNNSLHVSALAWSYSVFAASLFAYVFGAVVDNYNFLKTMKTNETIRASTK
jgi:hypothetical protein